MLLHPGLFMGCATLPLSGKKNPCYETKCFFQSLALNNSSLLRFSLLCLCLPHDTLVSKYWWIVWKTCLLLGLHITVYTSAVFLSDYDPLLLPAYPNQLKETSACSIITPKALCPWKEELQRRKSSRYFALENSRLISLDGVIPILLWKSNLSKDGYFLFPLQETERFSQKGKLEA